MSFFDVFNRKLFANHFIHFRSRKSTLKIWSSCVLKAGSAVIWGNNHEKNSVPQLIFMEFWISNSVSKLDSLTPQNLYCVGSNDKKEKRNTEKYTESQKSKLRKYRINESYFLFQACKHHFKCNFFYKCLWVF